VVFTLCGDICNIAKIVDEIKDAGKIAIVHMDLVDGLSGKESTVDFIKEHTKADGIISTKPALIKRAKELGLYTILRIFILDSMAFENIRKQMSIAKPDALEILPGPLEIHPPAAPLDQPDPQSFPQIKTPWPPPRCFLF
jgi:glycerol uptake operon antiterminator